MGLLLAAMQQGLALARAEQAHQAAVVGERQGIVNAFRADQADNYFNRAVDGNLRRGGVTPYNGGRTDASGAPAYLPAVNETQARFQLARQPFGIQQSQSNLLGALQQTYAQAPLAASAAINGNQGPANQLLANYTGQAQNGQFGLASLFGLGGNLGGALQTQGQGNLFSRILGGQNIFGLGVPQAVPNYGNGYGASPSSAYQYGTGGDYTSNGGSAVTVLRPGAINSGFAQTVGRSPRGSTY